MFSSSIVGAVNNTSSLRLVAASWPFKSTGYLSSQTLFKYAVKILKPVICCYFDADIVLVSIIVEIHPNIVVGSDVNNSQEIFVVQ